MRCFQWPFAWGRLVLNRFGGGGQRRRRDAAMRARFRQQTEALEDRCLLSVTTYSNKIDFAKLDAGIFETTVPTTGP